MNLHISTSFLGHLKYVKDELFVRSTKNKFQPLITLFTQISLYIIVECELHYFFLFFFNFFFLVLFSNLLNLKYFQIRNINILI